MLRALLIEDEAPARIRLADLLAAQQPPVAVVGTADSVRSAAAWLRANPAPDLIFADIQLGDGLSLELFRATPPAPGPSAARALAHFTPPPCPVVFTTAYDDYLLDAFNAHGIAYLLKPVKSSELAAALQKYRTLSTQFAASLAALAGQLLAPAGVSTRRHRILAQRGTTFQPVAIADVAYFFSESKLTFLVTRTGEKCLVNEPLATLETELDPREFFRLNRNFLAHVSAVKTFSSLGKGRLTVQLIPRAPEEVVISQERGAEFRAWAGA